MYVTCKSSIYAYMYSSVHCTMYSVHYTVTTIKKRVLTFHAQTKTVPYCMNCFYFKISELLTNIHLNLKLTVLYTMHK